VMFCISVSLRLFYSIARKEETFEIALLNLVWTNAEERLVGMKKHRRYDLVLISRDRHRSNEEVDEEEVSCLFVSHFHHRRY